MVPSNPSAPAWPVITRANIALLRACGGAAGSGRLVPGQLRRPSLVSVDLAFPAASAFRTWFADHVFQDPGIGEVAEEHNLALPDAEDLDGRRRERPARRGQGCLRPHLHDHHLRVPGLVELYL